jgi:alpha-L-fucosidase
MAKAQRRSSAGRSTTQLHRANPPEDIRFTVKGSSLYAIALGWPKDGQWIVYSLGSATATGKNDKVGDRVFWGLGTSFRRTQEADGLHIKLPAEPPGEYAYAFRVSLASSTAPGRGKRDSVGRLLVGRHTCPLKFKFDTVMA